MPNAIKPSANTSLAPSLRSCRCKSRLSNARLIKTSDTRACDSTSASSLARHIAAHQPSGRRDRELTGRDVWQLTYTPLHKRYRLCISRKNPLKSRSIVSFTDIDLQNSDDASTPLYSTTVMGGFRFQPGLRRGHIKVNTHGLLFSRLSQKVTSSNPKGRGMYWSSRQHTRATCPISRHLSDNCAQSAYPRRCVAHTRIAATAVLQ